MLSRNGTKKRTKTEKNKAKRDEDYREGLCRATYLDGSSVDGIDETDAGGPHTRSSLKLEINIDKDIKYVFPD